VARLRITITPPPTTGEEPLSFITLDLEPIEQRSVLYAALQRIEGQPPGWSGIETLPDPPPT
jgi:hypothetical protein